MFTDWAIEVALAYERISGHVLQDVVNKKLFGFTKVTLSVLLQAAFDVTEYFAERLYKSMKGAGTDDETLTRVIVTRCEVDMQAIKQTFEQRYHKTMAHWIQGDTSGDYRALLLALIGE